jgi:hypothetical protein
VSLCPWCLVIRAASPLFGQRPSRSATGQREASRGSNCAAGCARVPRRSRREAAAAFGLPCGAHPRRVMGSRVRAVIVVSAETPATDSSSILLTVARVAEVALFSQGRASSRSTRST